MSTNEYKSNIPQDVQVLNSFFDQFLTEFIEYNKQENEVTEEMAARLKEMMVYNCVGGKAFRGIQVVSTAQYVYEKQGKNFEEIKANAYAIGWAVEVLQAYFLVADDIMDKSITRRGQPCWYRLPTVQMDAVNDSFILHSFMDFLISKYSTNKDTWFTLTKLFQDVSLKTQLGQMIDLVSQPQGRKGAEVLKTFSADLQYKIVKYKTAFYTFYLPMAAGLVLAGITGDAELAVTKKICIELGVKFQIQDDYLDCYGDPKMIGKIGTDIQDHKCTWLLVQAMKLASPEQMKVIEENLGHEEEEKVAKIKQLYNDLDLPAVYAKQEADSLARVQALVDESKGVLPEGLFDKIIARVHGRQK